MTSRRLLSAMFSVLAGVAMAADLPSPALLVLNKEGSLAIVNPATNQVVGRVRTGDTPHEVAASNDGKLVFVSNYGGDKPGNSISVISIVNLTTLRAGQKDLEALAMEGQIKTGNGSDGMAWTPHP